MQILLRSIVLMINRDERSCKILIRRRLSNVAFLFPASLTSLHFLPFRALQNIQSAPVRDVNAADDAPWLEKYAGIVDLVSKTGFVVWASSKLTRCLLSGFCVAVLLLVIVLSIVSAFSPFFNALVVAIVGLIYQCALLRLTILT